MRPREAYRELEGRYDRWSRVREAMQILGWDRAAMMPPEGIEARPGQMAALERHTRELLRDPEVESWLARAEQGASELDPWERANLREMRRMWRIRTAPDPELARKWVETGIECRAVWREARPADDFERLVPHLERVLSLTIDVADAIADKLGVSRYDALLERHAPGMRSERVDELFAEVESYLSGIIEAAIDRQGGASTPELVADEVAPERQHRAARRLMRAVGFDFDWGRLDTSPHGFCTGSRHDVRVTTRWDPADVREGLYCVLHETGHAMYNRRVPGDWERQPVGRSRGKAMHESQSLLVERFACRTPEFCRFAAPILREEFDAAGAFDADDFYRAVTHVERDLIRVEADEVTYPAHVVMRYRLERRLLDGDLEIEDLPRAWNRAMDEQLGITPPDDRDGCMQDIHWMDGMFGYFPTYLLGAMAGAQLFEAAHEAVPALREDLEEGEFGPLMEWLETSVHAKGSKLEMDDLLADATGGRLQSGALRRHLERRYEVA